MLISVCIPCYRSAKTIPIVVDRIRKQFEDNEDDYEIVLVNDGSPDNTIEVIEELCKNDDHIVGVDLMRNYGQASATLAALKTAHGDIMVTMDDDGQHPPERMYELINKLKEQKLDSVGAYFPEKKESFIRRKTGDLARSIMVLIGLKSKGIKSNSSFAAYSRDLVDKIKNYQSPFVSLSGFISHVTTKRSYVTVENQDRLAGRSGYTFKKRLKYFKNIFFSFSLLPLQISMTLGLFMAGAGFIGIIYLIIRKIVFPDVIAGYTSTNVIILLVGGLLLIAMGIMGEYIGRIYMTISGQPQSTIRRIINGKNKEDCSAD